jgi:hypothetical protein
LSTGSVRLIVPPPGYPRSIFRKSGGRFLQENATNIESRALFYPATRQGSWST